MSYIIVHVDDQTDLNTMEIMPDEEGSSIKRFETKIEALKFLNKIGLGPEIWYNSDIHVLRLH